MGMLILSTILVAVLSCYAVLHFSKKKNKLIENFATDLKPVKSDPIKIEPQKTEIAPIQPKTVVGPPPLKPRPIREAPKPIQMKGGGIIPPPPPFIWDLIDMPILKPIPIPPESILNGHPPKVKKKEPSGD